MKKASKFGVEVRRKTVSVQLEDIIIAFNLKNALIGGYWGFEWHTLDGRVEITFELARPEDIAGNAIKEDLDE